MYNPIPFFKKTINIRKKLYSPILTTNVALFVTLDIQAFQG